MSRTREANAPVNFPIEIWEKIAQFSDLPTLYNLIKAFPFLERMYDTLVIPPLIEALQAQYPTIAIDSRVSIKRLIKLPSMVEVVNKDNFEYNEFLNHIVKGIRSTALLWECCGGSGNIGDTISLIVDIKNADLHGFSQDKHENPLLYAIITGYFPNAKGNSPFAKVVAQVMQKLIEAGAPINAQNAYGETALHKAASFGSNMNEPREYEGSAEPILKILLENGADVNVLTTVRVGQYASHSTPLHFALRQIGDTVHGLYNIQNLLDHLANPLLPDANGSTPLSIAMDKWNRDKTQSSYTDEWYSAQTIKKIWDNIIIIEELVEPQQLWEAYDNSVEEYVISGDLSPATSSDIS